MKILIISPDGWGDYYLSKHHFSIELSKLGHKVYFLNFANKQRKFFFQPHFSVQKTDFENLFEINYNNIIPGFKFIPPQLLRGYFKTLAKKITSTIGVPDIVWSFDVVRFPNLNVFGSNKRVFHLVDKKGNQYFGKEIVNSATHLISLDHLYLDQFDKKRIKPRLILNHGLADSFLKSPKPVILEGKNKLKALYIGNLGNSGLYFNGFKKLVSNFKNVDFYFIGPFVVKEKNKSGKDFKDFILESKNAFYLGAKSPEELKDYVNKVDICLLVYDLKREPIIPLPNSHKILEYLSGGKVIFSCPIGAYLEFQHLFSVYEITDKLIETFRDTLQNIDIHNSNKKIEERMNLARQNLYSIHVRKSLAFVNN